MGVRAAMQRWVRFPAWVYQRQQGLWNRVVLAGGWTWLYWMCSSIEPWLRLLGQENGATGAALLPAQWRIVMAALVLILGTWRPVAGYAAFVVAVAYPLYLISIYVMALGLAVLVLLAPVMALYAERGVLFMALLVLATVALAPLHLAPLVPLLVGLWWRGAGSWIGGGAAALWLKLCAAMSGQSTDLWLLYGWQMRVEQVYRRFHSANSLQTVALVLHPFGIDLASLARRTGLEAGSPYPVPAGLYVLFNLLQVCAWAAAAFVVSAMMDHLTVRWAGRNRAGTRAALCLLPGLALVWLGFAALPAWLGVDGPQWLDPPWLVAQMMWMGVVAWVLDAMLRYLHRPGSLAASGEAAFSTRRAGELRQTAPGLPEQGEAEGAAYGVGHPLGATDRPGIRVGRKRARGRGSEQAPDQAADIMIELD